MLEKYGPRKAGEEELKKHEKRSLKDRREKKKTLK